MNFLIHEADPPLSLPVVIIVFVPTFQNKLQAKTMLATGETVGLAEWIIDDICLVLIGSMVCFNRNFYSNGFRRKFPPKFTNFGRS